MLAMLNRRCHGTMMTTVERKERATADSTGVCSSRHAPQLQLVGRLVTRWLGQIGLQFCLHDLDAVPVSALSCLSLFSCTVAAVVMARRSWSAQLQVMRPNTFTLYTCNRSLCENHDHDIAAQWYRCAKSVLQYRSQRYRTSWSYDSGPNSHLCKCE